ncbi:response regulator [bacterium]|nr:response regulator [candidate division CSSED10-310 bacterium]
MRNSNVILLVEDNPDHAELIIDALKDYHVQNEIVWTESGEEALDFLCARGKYATDLRTQKPILVLLDIKLPGIDGIEVLRSIKEMPDVANIPVVMLTTSREESEILKSYQYHASSYIVKPINFNEFMEALKNLNMYWHIVTLPTRTADKAGDDNGQPG